METNAMLVQQIYRLMEARNDICAKRKQLVHPLPEVSTVNELNRDMLLKLREQLILNIKTLDPRYNLSSIGIVVTK